MRFTLGIPLLLMLACGSDVDGTRENSQDDSTTTDETNPESTSRFDTGTETPSSDEAGSEGQTSVSDEGTADAADAADTDPSESDTAETSAGPIDSSSDTTSDGEVSGTPELPEGLPLELKEALEDAKTVTATSFAERSAVTFEALSYDPEAASGLDLIQGSDLGLTEGELAKYKENGFVISTRQGFPHFGYGYASIYAQDLPLFISADSILFALHTSYDAILKNLEVGLLIPEATNMVTAMRANLAAVETPSDDDNDVDVYLTVAQSLLLAELQPPTYAQNADAVAEFYAKCTQAGSAESVTLFGTQREFDFSQFKPRGHYTDSLELQRYFRAMIWMGRVEFKLINTEVGEPELNRRETEAAVLLRSVMDESAKQSHQRIDAVVTAFVGEHDSMTPSQIDALMRDLNVSSPTELPRVTDKTLFETIVDGGYGVQRILSQIMTGGINSTKPLPAAFALFGQRYVIDSHVFSNVVYDRVKQGAVKRMMPNPLDVAYAALQNDQAGLLLQSELETYDYASDLASMRAVVDAEPSEFWELNLYNRWLDALRRLSPDRAMQLGEGENLPQIARTEAWGRRLLNTQMASWAELRHDTILYVKQSYTSGATCEYPDAYVDPYPEFFGAVAALAEHALVVLAEQGLATGEISDTAPLEEQLASLAVRDAQAVLSKFVEVGSILEEMALHQRTGEPHSEEHMAFVNEAVQTQIIGCGGPEGQTGWYSQLFMNKELTWDPTIADVHTQPTDEGGSPVGRVLHVGTGESHLMVTSVETCAGPRAYAGLVSSYYERIESDWKRLDDIEWKEILATETPASPSWVTSLTAE